MEFTILKDIVIIFALSTGVNLIFTKIKIPTVVGYLMTGVIAGLHLLSIVHREHEIEVLGEIGVILLLFTIGLEFSLKHLLKIRRIVFFGGTIAGYGYGGTVLSCFDILWPGQADQYFYWISNGFKQLSACVKIIAGAI